MGRQESLSEFMSAHADSVLKRMHCALICKVVKYDSTKQMVDLQPCVSQSFTDEAGNTAFDTFPVITNIPVKFTRAGQWRITHPVPVGTYGILHIVDHSMDTWLVSGGTVDPEDPRSHDLSDGVFDPGLIDFGNATPHSEDTLTIGHADGHQIHISENQITIGDSNPVNLDSVALATPLKNFLDNFIATYLGHTHPLPTGVSSAPSGPIVTVPDFASGSIKAKV